MRYASGMTMWITRRPTCCVIYIITDFISGQGAAIGPVRPLVSAWKLTFDFDLCLRVGHGSQLAGDRKSWSLVTGYGNGYG